MRAVPLLSPECRLVFRSAHPAWDAAEASELAGAVKDWQRVVILAEREYATAGLWHALRGSETSIPSEVAGHLRRRAMVSDFRMQHMSRQLQHIASVLAERDVPVLLLKGAAMGALTDPTFRSRPMSDIDVLVHRVDSGRASTAIGDAGWPQTADPVLHQLMVEQHHLPPFLDPQMPGVRLELHLSILPAAHPFAFDESDLWREARAAPEPFAGALVPSLEHLLLHACVHFAWQHMAQFGAWRTFRGVGSVVSSAGFDWERFVPIALAARAATACYWTLRLAQRLSGIAVPAAVLARLAPPTPDLLRDAIERHFVAALAPGEAPVSPSTLLTRLLWRAALRPKWSGHGASIRWDSEHRWERARGEGPTENVSERAARHLAGYRDWWRFFAGTLMR